MVFSSHIFIFYFLPLTLLLYYTMTQRYRNLLLTLLSYVFYGWTNPLFGLLMLGSTAIDYVCGLIISNQLGFRTSKGPPPLLPRGEARTRTQRIALIVSIASNLSLLGFFKYFNFAVESWTALAAALGLSHLGLDLAFQIALPLGISFYTFQSMSYAIDVYRGDARAIRNVIDFACFVAMFPQLVAGPIIRFADIAEQLQQRSHTLTKFARGVAFFSVGLAKKVLFANPCGKVADTVFDAASVTFLDAWYGAIAYAFQIYFDFSAYSDMAIGLGLMLGFVFAKNFDSPYEAQSITDFWRRWHISLSTWLRDYLYIPLGGNRLGARRTYLNLSIVMVLGGLWHGASWNFVIWGALHGGLLACERACGKRPIYYALPKPLRVGCTFVIVLFTWVFFRAKDLPTALNYCATMLGLGSPEASALLLSGIIAKPYYLATVALCALIVWTCPQTWDWSKQLNTGKAATALMLFVIAVAVLSAQAYNPFIYFIF
ncbi:MAG: MBOAT family protein [Deltaproteobacteria bacterium]|nr:MBOAT family protein [Deltaproteobacteria bacterium]